jgi:hypothetical protein
LPFCFPQLLALLSDPALLLFLFPWMLGAVQEAGGGREGGTVISCDKFAEPPVWEVAPKDSVEI